MSEKVNEHTIADLLEQQPGIILAEELALITLTQAQEADLLTIKEIEVNAKAEADMNLSFKNEGQRKASMLESLNKNEMYQSGLKITRLNRTKIFTDQAHLAYQRDLFRAYLAIAGL